MKKAPEDLLTRCICSLTGDRPRTFCKILRPFPVSQILTSDRPDLIILCDRSVTFASNEFSRQKQTEHCAVAAQTCRHKNRNDELYFREYLNEHPRIAREYEALKLELWKKYEYNRDAYTNEKTKFIRKWTTEARRKYGDRY